MLWNDLLFLLLFFKVDSPSIQNGFPSQLYFINEDHPTSRNGSRGCHKQVLDFKHHGEGDRKLNSLAVGQTQHPVIVQHRVHVFYPNSVDGSIEQHPLFSIRLVGDCISYDFSHDSLKEKFFYIYFIYTRLPSFHSFVSTLT
jgi:hypothetical protein